MIERMRAISIKNLQGKEFIVTETPTGEPNMFPKNPQPKKDNVIKKPEAKITLLLDTSNAYESLIMGDPGHTRKEVSQLYLEAEKDARAMDKRRGTHFGENPITSERLHRLGYDPETLRPLEPPKKRILTSKKDIIPRPHTPGLF